MRIHAATSAAPVQRGRWLPYHRSLSRKNCRNICSATAQFIYALTYLEYCTNIQGHSRAHSLFVWGSEAPLVGNPSISEKRKRHVANGDDGMAAAKVNGTTSLRTNNERTIPQGTTGGENGKGLANRMDTPYVQPMVGLREGIRRLR